MTETAVREWPILFSGMMVEAILDGRKTQTRRIVKGADQLATVVGRDANGELSNLVPRPMPDWQVEDLLNNCPYGQPGDRLWVRETFGFGWDSGAGFYTALPPTGRENQPEKIFYKVEH